MNTLKIYHILMSFICIYIYSVNTNTIVRYSGTSEHRTVKTIFDSLLKASMSTRPDKASEEVFIQLIPVLKLNW